MTQGCDQAMISKIERTPPDERGSRSPCAPEQRQQSLIWTGQAVEMSLGDLVWVQDLSSSAAELAPGKAVSSDGSNPLDALRRALRRARDLRWACDTSCLDQHHPKVKSTVPFVSGTGAARHSNTPAPALPEPNCQEIRCRKVHIMIHALSGRRCSPRHIPALSLKG